MALAVLGMSGAAIADDTSTTGGITGIVIGAEGEGLPGARVTVLGDDVDTPRVVVSGAGGVFRVAGLLPSVYTLDVQLRGFHPNVTGGIVVEPGEAQRVTVVLSSATFRDTVSIRAESVHSTLEASEVRESGALDLGEALSRQSQVWKVRKGGIANDVVVRGLREDDVTVLIDGARVAGACPNRMDPPAFHLDFAELDRVEIASESDRLAAQGSLGGLVNVTTRKPTEGFGAEASVVAGSWGRFNPSATVNYGRERWAVLAGVSQRSGEPYEDGSGTRFTDMAGYSDRVDGVDAYDVLSVWGRGLVVPADNHELTFSLSHQEADNVLYPTLMMDAVYDDTDRFVAGYTWTPGGESVAAVRTTAYATRVDHWMDNALRTSAGEAPRGWSMGTMAETRMVGTSAEVEVGEITFGAEAYLRRWNVWTELAGMSYMRQASLPDVESTVVGVSARWRHAIGSVTNLELGGRYDWMDSQADADLADTDLYAAYHGIRTTSWSEGGGSLSVRLTRELAPALELSGSLAHATRPPDPRELFFGLKRMGADWVGNPSLDAPQSNRLDVSLDWRHDRGSVTVATWVDAIDGFIYLYDQPRIQMLPGIMNQVARSYANVDARLWGVSLEATQVLGERWSLSGGVSYLEGSKDAVPELGIVSGNLAEMPPLTARLAVRWQNPRWFVEVEGVAMAEQDRVDPDLGEEAAPAWAIGNLRAGFATGPWQLLLVVDNLFDRTYFEHFSYFRDPFRSGIRLNEPGRSFSLRLGWRP